MPTIPLTGLTPNYAVPGHYFEINPLAGPASAGASTYSVLLMGNKLAGGSATADTVVYGPDSATPMSSEQDAKVLFGEGSELHRMVKAFLKVNQSTPLYAIAVTESAGAAATGVLTITGPATSAGAIRIFINDEFVDVGFLAGDSVTTIASAAVAAINAKTHWSVTASSSVGVVTITAKNKGLRGNQIRHSVRVIPGSGTGVGTSLASSTGFFTGGTTADSNTNALATLLPNRYYYIVSASNNEGGSSTQFAALASQVATQALPLNGIRQRVIGATSDTIGNATTFAQGINNTRAEVLWFQNSDVPPSELAAFAAGVYSLYEASSSPRLNFSGFGADGQTAPLWTIKQPNNVAGPTKSQQAAALNAGLSPIAVGRAGSTYLVKRITTYSLNGATSDFRARDAHKMTVVDLYADDLGAKYQAQFGGKSLAADVPAGEKQPGPNVVTPRLVKACVDALTRSYFDRDLLENVEVTTKNTQVLIDPSSPNRISVRVPLDIVNILDQTATLVEVVG